MSKLSVPETLVVYGPSGKEVARVDTTKPSDAAIGEVVSRHFAKARKEVADLAKAVGAAERARRDAMTPEQRHQLDRLAPASKLFRD